MNKQRGYGNCTGCDKRMRTAMERPLCAACRNDPAIAGRFLYEKWEALVEAYKSGVPVEALAPMFGFRNYTSIYSIFNSLRNYGYEIENRRIVGDDARRFWSKVRIAGPDECWEWQGKCASFGYGLFSVRGRRHVGAHRFAYEITKGPIPEGLIVRHTCDNPPCVNPTHLLVGTKRDNMQDCLERGRLVSNLPNLRGKAGEGWTGGLPRRETSDSAP